MSRCNLEIPDGSPRPRTCPVHGFFCQPAAPAGSWVRARDAKLCDGQCVVYADTRGLVGLAIARVSQDSLGAPRTELSPVGEGPFVTLSPSHSVQAAYVLELPPVPALEEAAP